MSRRPLINIKPENIKLKRTECAVCMGNVCMLFAVDVPDMLELNLRSVHLQSCCQPFPMATDEENEEFERF